MTRLGGSDDPGLVTVPEELTAAVEWAESVLGERATRVRRLLGGETGVILAVESHQGSTGVLRLITEEPWRTHGPALATRESQVQQMLVASEVPAPASLALDATGDRCGHPAHLMTLLPGEVDLTRVDEAALAGLAEELARIHDVRPSIEVRPYQSWAWEAKYVVPGWAECPDHWTSAFALLRSEPPPYEPVFLHRDYSPRNVLWSQGSISGVVDWVEASRGPAWLDVAHCCTNIALLHGEGPAQGFAEAYVAVTGRTPDAYWDVMDVVGFLPDPRRTSFLERSESRPQRRALEHRLGAAMARL